jgi:TonB family protein
MMRPSRRFLPAISTGLLCVILSSNRLIGEGTGNAAGELDGVDIAYQKKTGETHYIPSDYRWPPPDIDMYPVIVRSDSGAKRLLLRVALHGVADRKMRDFEMTLDGVSTHLDLNESGKSKVDIGGCRPTAEVDLPGHEDLMHRIAAATDIEAAYGEAKRRIAYQFVPEDWERFRRVLAIFDKGDLPPAQKPGQPGAPMKEGDYPKIASSVAPEYPRDARMKHISASVTLEAMILRDGSVGRIRVLKPAGRGCGFEEAALAAVRQWKYLPGKVKGQPADVKFKIVIDFSLQGSDPMGMGVDSRDRRPRNQP